LPRSTTLRLLHVLLLALASVLFLFSLLAVFRAPFNFAWKLAIVATEWGYHIAPAGLVFFFGWNRGRLLRIAALLGVASTMLLLSPLIRATGLGQLDLMSLVRGSEVVRTTPVRLHNRIGQGDSLPIDFYPAKPTAGRAPLVIVIHGGSWRGGHPGELAGLNHMLVQQGYAVAAITYRLAPLNHHPVQLRDVNSAIAHLRSNADTLGFNGAAITLIGRSAGGHLALLAAYQRPEPAIKGVVSFYGPTDLIWGYEHPGPPLVIDTRGTLEDFLGGTPSTVPAAYQQASPLLFAANAPPTLLIHGTRDELVNVTHSRRLTDALRSAGKEVDYIELPWATHACDYFLFGPCGQITTQAILAFLTRVNAR
jgi:acetyl esterase/lipase